MEYFLLDQLSRCSFIYIYRTPNFPIERREAFKNLCFNQLCCILMNLQGVYTEKRRVIDGEGHLRHMTGCRLLHVNGTTLLKSPVILKAALMYRCTALIPSIAKKNKHIYSFKLVKKKTSNSGNYLLFTNCLHSTDSNCQFHYSLIVRVLYARIYILK